MKTKVIFLTLLRSVYLQTNKTEQIIDDNLNNLLKLFHTFLLFNRKHPNHYLGKNNTSNVMYGVSVIF